MLRAPSNQKNYDAVFSGDGAFVQLPDNPTAEQREEHARKWKIARETGDYSALRLEGTSDPTTFTLRPLSVDQFALLIDMRRGGVGINEVNVLAFRTALVSVQNFTNTDIKRTQHKKLGPIATTEFLDKAGLPAGLSLQVAVELGNLAIEKAAGLSGK